MKKVLITLLLASFASHLYAMENALPSRLRDMCEKAKEKNGRKATKNCKLLACFFDHIKTNNIRRECLRSKNDAHYWMEYKRLFEHHAT